MIKYGYCSEYFKTMLPINSSKFKFPIIYYNIIENYMNKNEFLKKYNLSSNNTLACFPLPVDMSASDFQPVVLNPEEVSY